MTYSSMYARPGKMYSPEELELQDKVIDEHQTSAPDYLRKAAELMDERGKEYDSEEGERSMGKAVIAFNAITGQTLKESEGWLLLQLLKDARQWTKKAYHADSAEDCIAYSALKAEALEQGL